LLHFQLKTLPFDKFMLSRLHPLGGALENMHEIRQIIIAGDFQVLKRFL